MPALPPTLIKSANRPTPRAYFPLHWPCSPGTRHACWKCHRGHLASMLPGGSQVAPADSCSWKQLGCKLWWCLSLAPKIWLAHCEACSIFHIPPPKDKLLVQGRAPQCEVHGPTWVTLRIMSVWCHTGITRKYHHFKSKWRSVCKSCHLLCNRRNVLLCVYLYFQKGTRTDQKPITTVTYRREKVGMEGKPLWRYFVLSFWLWNWVNVSHTFKMLNICNRGKK